jgi:hypothetical protein
MAQKLEAEAGKDQKIVLTGVARAKGKAAGEGGSGSSAAAAGLEVASDPGGRRSAALASDSCNGDAEQEGRHASTRVHEFLQ